MDDFFIREATLADRDDVLQIRDETMDYLPDYYNYFMRSRDITPFVLLHKDRIIGFNVAFIIDGGQTVVSRSARIHTEYEGRGLYKLLDNHIMEWAKHKHVRTKVFTTSDENQAITRPSFNAVYKQILSMTILSYVIDTEHLKVKTSETGENFVRVTKDMMMSYINSKQISGYLFSQGRFLVDGVPFQLLLSNVPLMFAQNDVTVMFSDVLVDGNVCKGLLSVGTIQHIKNQSYVYNIEIYGTDIISVNTHISRHLNILKSKANNIVCMFIFIENAHLETAVDEIFHQYGISRKLWHDSKIAEVYLTKRLVYEQTLT